MLLEINDTIIRNWEERSKELDEGDNTKLTPKILKEMVEDFLYDYFS